MQAKSNIFVNAMPARALRALLAVFALLFALQMVGAGVHKHALAELGADCASCVLAHHTPAPDAPPPTLAPAVPLALAYVIPVKPVLLPVHTESYLIPAAQAPPSSLTL